MTIASSRAAIANALANIPGLVVHDHMPDAIQEFPAVAMRLEAVDYPDATYRFRLLLAVAGWEEEETQQSLEPYLELGGNKSVRAAIDALSGFLTLAAERVERKRINSVPYTGAEFIVAVIDS